MQIVRDEIMTNKSSQKKFAGVNKLIENENVCTKKRNGTPKRLYNKKQ